MACQRQAYQTYLADQQALDDAFAEFGVEAEKEEFEFEVMTIWREFEPILPLFDYIVLQHNSFNGHVMGIDWIAVDILLRREDVTVTPDDFANFRAATDGYVNSINEHLTHGSTA
ncbi:hypothetical protein [Psychrobacter sp. FDAARGOS_221]|uniref:hypothetical protein n=1 Tax=Psychrobacter sp. FDAARGOS_221 TaxID=1975705 RepID=UPI000BB59466|nr:hypothetical protein [Psychrobacter sp. FDAARGOS_221]PNK59467.1 hypothetical protein A6J60_000230 [Psychrobacter sp. FDAARGOS_221]PNK61464.1 hypothetical protein A6J60_011715 [Psychrobacter sp. FDAARGOS_221]